MKLQTLSYVLIISIIPFLLFSQSNSDMELIKSLPYKKKLKYADDAFAYGNYFQAMDLYKSFLAERPDDNELLYKVAYCYMEARDYKNADAYFTKAIAKGNTEAKTYYYKALMLNKQAKYNDARNTYAKAVKKNVSPWSEMAKEKIKSCDFAEELLKDPVNFEITHLERPVNGPFTEYAPRVYDNEFYYSSLNTDSLLNQEFRNENNKNFSRIYKRLSSEDQSWEAIKPLSSPFNGSDFHSGNYTLSADGKRAYFTKCQDEGNANVTCKIYLCVNTDGTWSNAIELSSGVNASKANNTHPALGGKSGDNDILYFTSDREEGQGGNDIYFAEVDENGKATNVTNLGSSINTSGNEKTPFYDAENELLYFSSDFHLGMGGFDNFRTNGSLSEWKKPENLGYPINSSADDQFFVQGEDRNTYYFVSNRPGIIGLKSETCCDDIFMAKDLFIPDFVVKGEIIEKLDSTTTTSLKGVTVTVYSIENDKETLFAIDSNNNKSSYFHSLSAGNNYMVEFKKQGYFTIKEYINTTDLFESDTFVVDATLEKIRKDKSYSLSNIYYAYNSSELNEDSKKTLDQLYVILSENEHLKFELSSHTDSIGSTSYNQRLSQKRAKTCVDYLHKKGIDQSQLIAKGYGESQPIAPNSKPGGKDNPEGRAKNRRTEYRVIGEMEYSGDQIILESGK